VRGLAVVVMDILAVEINCSGATIRWRRQFYSCHQYFLSLKLPSRRPKSNQVIRSTLRESGGGARIVGFS
jgi:hypothetical protein